MKITCKYCNGTGKVNVKVGDIVTPRDGSGMPNGLHTILFNGIGSSPPFNPVKVLHIEGSALFVVPIDLRGKEFEEGPYGARSWMEIDGEGVSGFWIYAPFCHIAS